MKKAILVLILVGAVVAAKAQTAAGSMMIGGGFEITSVKPEAGTASTSISVNPSLAYFMSDGLAIGVGLSLGKTETSSDFGIGPFARYYKFVGDDKKFAFFGQGSVTLGFGKDEIGAPPVEVKSSSFTLAISPGFAYFFTEKWVLDFQLSGIRFRTGDPNKDSAAVNDKSTTIEFGATSFAPSLGFRYCF